MSTQSPRHNPADAHHLISPPLDVLFETLLSDVCSRICHGVDDAVRANAVHLLHNYAILNRESAGIVRGSGSYPAVMWYERVKRNWLFVPASGEDPSVKPMGFFLEGLPRGLPLFGAPVALQLPPAKCRALDVRDVRDERVKTVNKLDTMADATRLQGLAEQLDRLADMPHIVPQRVRIFVSRMRSVCLGVRESRPSSEFTQCRNVQCNRFFFCGSDVVSWPPINAIRACYKAGETPIEVLDLPKMDPQSCDRDAGDYWSGCGGIPWYRDPLQRFCTSACCIEWRRQMDRAVPGGVEYDTEQTIKRVGIGRINKAFDAALKRNALLASKLKETKRARKKAKSVCKETLRCEISSRVDMLNIDLGVLYWSTLMSGCPENIYNRALPGDRPGWRGDPLHVRTARTLSLIYEDIHMQYPSHRRLITDTLSLPKFFSAIKTQSARLL